MEAVLSGSGACADSGGEDERASPIGIPGESGPGVGERMRSRRPALRSTFYALASDMHPTGDTLPSSEDGDVSLGCFPTMNGPAHNISSN